jgi:nitrite reductase (NADH) small subunit
VFDPRGETIMAFVALEKLHQLHDGYRQLFRIQGREWLLIQDEGRLYCIANQCPHLQAPLARGSISDGAIRCPSHGIEFILRTGMPTNPLACRHALTFLNLIYEGNQVGFDLLS